MHRRDVVAAMGVVINFPLWLTRIGRTQVRLQPVNLASVPLDTEGDWPDSDPQDALKVVSRVRDVALAGIRLLSDHQPLRIRVVDHRTGPPRVWLHKDTPGIAWIIVDIGVRRWAQLAYQFGHELGHVLCNSWLPETDLKPPTRWLEEALVDAFSIRNLALLAESWEKNPLFPAAPVTAMRCVATARKSSKAITTPANRSRPLMSPLGFARHGRPWSNRTASTRWKAPGC